MKFLILFISTIAGAATTTWDACVKEAIQRSYDVQAAYRSVEKARADYRASYSGFFPQLSADAGYDQGDRSGHEYTYGLTAKQNLFSGFKDNAGVQKAKADLDAAENRLAIAKAKLSFDLKTGFAAVLFAEDQLKLAKEIATRRKANVRLVELRFEGGRENKGSFLRIKAFYRQAQYEVAQAERNVRVAQRQLLRAIGRSEADELTVDAKWEIPKLAGKPSLRELVFETPQYQLASAEAKSAERSAAVAGAQFFPELSLSGSVGKRGEEFPPANNRWSVGVTLSFPFFSGGKGYYGYQAARSEERRAELALKSSHDQILLKLEETFASFHDAVERTEVQEEFFRASELRAEVARSKYTNGLISFEDWDIIENDLINTQKARLSSFRDAYTSQAAWEQARGTGAIP